MGLGGYPDYPAGGLKTNVEQLAHFLIAWTQDSKWDNRQVFDSSTVQTLTPNDFQLGFHLWFLYGTGKGNLLICIPGGETGYRLLFPLTRLAKRD